MKKILAFVLSLIVVLNGFAYTTNVVDGSLVELPEVPVGISASSTETSITINWSAASNATSYVVSLSGNPVPTSETTIQFNDLSPGTEYTYKVKAVNIEGESAYSDSASISTKSIYIPITPDIPNNITASATETTVLISWSSAANATTYDLWFDGNVVNEDGISHTFTELTPGTSHTYKIRSVGAENNSEYSDAQSISTNEIIVPVVPNIPSGIVKSTTETSVTVSWSEDLNATSYTLNFDDVEYPTNSTTYTINDLLPSTNHTFKVSATNGVGSSAYSQLTSVKTDDHIPLIPDIPTNISATSTEFTITLSWTPSNEATSYIVSLNGEETTTSETQKTFTGLISNSDYTYKIKASNITGSSDYSTLKTIKTKLEKPSVPTGVVLTATSRNITIKWNAVINAESYEVIVDSSTISTTNTTYIVTELQPNTQHTFQVRAKNISGVSASSESKSIMTLQEIPLIPSGVNVGVTERTLTVSWPVVARAESYDVSIDGKVINTNASNYTFSELKTDTTYSIKVRSKNSAGSSDYSVAIYAKTLEEIPKVPQVISANASTRSATISWNAVDGAKTYEVNFNGTIEVTSKTTVTFNGLNPSTTYSYTVKAKNGAGASPASSVKTVRTSQELPSSPQQISASAAEKSITVRWNPISDATSYDVFFNGTIQNTPLTSITFTDLKPDTKYTYKVRSINGAGVSQYSTLYEVRTNKETPVVLTTPNQVNAIIDSRGLVITWTLVKNAESYDVSINGIIQSVQNNMFTVKNPLPDTTYEYSVRAKNKDGSSEFSNIKTIRTQGIAPNVPNITKGTTTESSISLSWEKVINATEYELDFNGTLKSTTDASVVFTNLEPNTYYVIKIRAKNKFGNSAYSKEWVYQTHNKIPDIPNVNKVTANATSISISWENIKTATTYEININGTTYKTERTTYTITGLEPNSEYKYSIRAINPLGASTYSVMKTITTTNLVSAIKFISIADNNIVSMFSNESYILQWEPVNLASKYIVRISDIEGNFLLQNVSVSTPSLAIETNQFSRDQYKINIQAFDVEGKIIGNGDRSVVVDKLISNVLPNATIINLEDEAVLPISFDEVLGENIEYKLSLVNVITNTSLYEQKIKTNMVTISANVFEQGITNCRLVITAYDSTKVVAQSTIDFEVRGKSVQLDKPDIERMKLSELTYQNEPYTLYWKNVGTITPDSYLINVYRNNLLYFSEDKLKENDELSEFSYEISGDVFSETGNYMIEIIANKEGFKSSQSKLVFLKVGDPNKEVIITKMYESTIDYQITLKAVLISNGDRQVKAIGFLWGNNLQSLNDSPIYYVSDASLFSMKLTTLEENTKYYYRAYVEFDDGTRLEGNTMAFKYAKIPQKNLPIVFDAAYNQTVDISSQLTEKSESESISEDVTFSIITNDETNTLVFVNQAGISISYKGSYETFGDKHIWTIKHKYRDAGSYQELIYACNGLSISEPMAVNLIVGKTTAMNQEITLEAEAIPEEITGQVKGFSDSIRFDGISKELFMISNDEKLKVEGNIFSVNGSAIQEVNMVIDETVKLLYKKTWLNNEKLTELAILETIRVHLNEAEHSKSLYVHVVLEDGSIAIYQIIIVKAKITIENKPYLNVGETIDLRLYAQIDDKNSKNISDKVLYLVDNNNIASINGNTLKGLNKGVVTIEAYYEINGIEGNVKTNIQVNETLIEFEKTIYDNLKEINQKDYESKTDDLINQENCTLDDYVRTIASSGSAYCALASVVNAIDLTQEIGPKDILADMRGNNEKYSTFFDCQTETVGKLFSSYLLEKGISNVTQLKYISFVESGLRSRIIETLMEEKPIIALMSGDRIKEGSSNIFTDTNHYVILKGVKVYQGETYIQVIDSDSTNQLIESRLKRWYNPTTNEIWIPLEYILSDISELNIVN